MVKSWCLAETQRVSKLTMAVMVEEAVKAGAKEEGFWCQLGGE